MKLNLLKFKVILIFALSGIFTINSLLAQLPTSSVIEGKIRIKVKPAVASSLNLKKSFVTNAVSTGVKSLDQLNRNYAVTEMKRVFPYSPKFEDRHKKYGLDLWYEISTGTKASASTVAADYRNLQEVDKAELLYETKLVDGSGAPVYLASEILARTADQPFNDPYLAKQWNYNNTGQSGGTEGADINLFNAWKINVGNPKIIVSIHDMGVQVDHDDLKNMMWVNKAELNGQPGIDDDGNGYIDDVNGFNFTNHSGTIETGYHATHVAGTIAAENNNGIGVSGVAGGSGKGDGVRIMSCQILGGTHQADVPESYVYAADNGAVISQNSWGYTDPLVYEQSTLDAIDYFIAEAGNYAGSPMKGGVVIFAAGNSNIEELSYPGAYASCIAVSSLDAMSTKASYSNFGNWVDIAAPGGASEEDITIGAGKNYSNGILSTLDHNSYGYLDGTSMACPHVSGVAALIVSKYGSSTFTNNDLKTHLLTGVRNINIIPDNSKYVGKLGAGELDAVLGLANDNKLPPSKINDLAITGIAQDFATISWTVPADPDDEIPTSFEILYSQNNITLSTLINARVIPLINTSGAGQKLTFEIDQLQSLTNYFFAIRSKDRWGNYSEISNVLNRSTNSGPVASLDSLKSMLAISINVNSRNTGSDSILFSNNGAGILRWDGLARHVSAVPLSVKPLLHYPVLQNGQAFPMGILSSIARPLAMNNIQRDTVEAKAYIDYFSSLMVYGETNLALSNSSATRFFVDDTAGFNLTNTQVYIQHNSATGPVIVEVYKGYDINTAQLLHAQEIPVTNSNDYTYVQFDEQIFLEKGSYFWLVFHVPAGNKFPLGGGVQLNKGDSKNCYMSLNGGKTWRLFQDLYQDNQIAWAVFAISTQVNIDQYIKLSPDTGIINPGGSVRIVASVDALDLINGQYRANVVINTNQTGKPYLRIPAIINVQGHKPVIAQIKRVDFGSVFIGNSVKVRVTVRNAGLGRFIYKSPGTILNNPQFTLLSSAAGTIESGDQQDLLFAFNPSALGNIICRVTLVEANGNNYSFELFGVGIDPPVGSINPESVSVNGLSIGDTIRSQFYLSNKGKYSLDYYLPAFADGSNMLSIPDNIQKFGYRTRVDSTGSSFAWDDIASTGTDITAGFSGNDMHNIYQKVPLNFLFPFYGKNENFVSISKYGVISFSDNGTIWSQSPMSFKSSVNPDRYICAFGYPMLFQEAGFGKVYYKRADDKFIIQYEDVPNWDGVGYSPDFTSTFKSSTTFQVVLYDNGNISLFYKTCSMSQADRSTALISMEDKTRRDGIWVSGPGSYPWSVKYGFSFKPGSAVHFISPGLGLFSNINQPFGSVLPGDSIKISYQIKTDSLYLLHYSENLVIVTNDPVNNPAIHSVDFTITKGGSSKVVPDTVNYNFGSVFAGGSYLRTLLITNTGKADDNIISASFDHGYFILQGNIPELLKPERTASYSVGIKTATLGSFIDTLRLVTLNGQILKISLAGTVIQGPTINVLNSTNTALSSITKLNIQAGTSAGSVLMRIKNTGAVNLNVAPVNTEWAIVSEKVSSIPLKSEYTWKTSKDEGGPTYDWMDISQSGIKITESLDPINHHEWTRGIKMPFTFSYYGNSYDSVYIGFSGLVTFTSGQNEAFYFWGGGSIPDTTQPNNYLAALFLFGGPDNYTDYPFAGQYYQMLSDRMIIEYKDYNSNFSMGPPVSFQIIIFKNGNIKYQYKMPESGNNTVTNRGTIGFENADGTEGTMISDNQIFVNSDMAIGIYPLKTYSVAPGVSKDFDVTLTAQELFAGSYGDSLLIINNDPTSLLKKIPLKLVVKGTPVVGLPDSIEFGDVLMDPQSPTIKKEFDLSNTGTANYSVLSSSQNLPVDFKLEAYIQSGNSWSWSELKPSSGIFPRTILPHTSMHMRLSISPVRSEILKDTFKIVSDAGNFSMPIHAGYYYPPVASVLDSAMNPADTLSVYALNDLYYATKTIYLKNANDLKLGGYKLSYGLSIDYQRDTIMPSGLNIMPSNKTDSITAHIVQGELGMMSKMSGAAVNASNYAKDANNFNRILANDTASQPATNLGYGGGFAFNCATAFDAPADGFNLSHVQTWYVPGSWLNSKILVKVYAGAYDINNAKLLYSQTFSYTSPTSDKIGKLLTFQLSKELSFFPNERFFIVFSYEAGALNPQGAVIPVKPEAGRFMFGPGDAWYDINTQGNLSKYGWMVRACEQHVKLTAWVTLDSPSTGELASGIITAVKLNFAGGPAMPGDNYANLVIKSNDPNNPGKIFILHFRKNMGPEFDESSMVFSTTENDTLRFSIAGKDMDGDNFSLALDTTYKFLAIDLSKAASSENSPKGVIPISKSVALIYTPDFNSQGTNIFYVKGIDSNGNINKGKITINVTNVNRPPMPLLKDTLFLDGNLNYFMVMPEYMFNDPDLNDKLTMEAQVDDPSVVTMYASGNSYILAPSSDGTTGITFTVSDPYGASATNVLQVRVRNVIEGISASKENKLNIYPNPTSGIVSINFPKLVNGELLITVSNSTGETVLLKKIKAMQGTSITIDLSTLPQGIYFTRLQSIGKVFVEKICKK